MITIKIQNKGISPETFLNNINTRLNKDGKAKVFEMSEKVVNYMRQYISNSKKRPSMGNNLEKTIEAEIIENTKNNFIIGIGNINKLKTDAPYFEVLDAGGYVPNYGNLVPVGRFAPGEPQPYSEFFRNGNWEIAGKGYTFRATRPIEGIGYINEGIKDLKREISLNLGEWIQKQLNLSAKEGGS